MDSACSSAHRRLLMAVAAALYSSVGHGGASAYLAIMALVLGGAGDDAADRAGAEPRRRRARRGALRSARPDQLEIAARLRGDRDAGRLLGGGIHLPPEYYRPLVGALLSAAAVRLFWSPKQLAYREVKAPRLLVDLARRRRARPARRADRDRRRHLPQPAHHPLRLGDAAPHVRRRGGLHLPQFDRRPARQSRRRCAALPAGIALADRRGRGRAPCSAPGSASRGCRANGCCRRSAWC